MTAPTPSGFAEIFSDDFPVLHAGDQAGNFVKMVSKFVLA
jgi:hypothetical protein